MADYCPITSPRGRLSQIRTVDVFNQFCSFKFFLVTFGPSLPNHHPPPQLPPSHHPNYHPPLHQTFPHHHTEPLSSNSPSHQQPRQTFAQPTATSSNPPQEPPFSISHKTLPSKPQQSQPCSSHGFKQNCKSSCTVLYFSSSVWKSFSCTNW